MKKNHKIGARQKKRNKEQNMLSMIMHKVDTSKDKYTGTLAPIQERDNPMITMAIFGNMVMKKIIMAFWVVCSSIRAFCLK